MTSRPEETQVTTAQAPPAQRSWTFDLPITTPLSLNGSRGNHYARARRVKALRNAAHLLAWQVKIPRCDRVAIELHYAPRDRRRRDALNLVATLKPVEDGLVDAGVVPDDTEEFVEPTMPRIDPPTGQPGRLYVIVTDLGSPT